MGPPNGFNWVSSTKDFIFKLPMVYWTDDVRITAPALLESEFNSKYLMPSSWVVNKQFWAVTTDRRNTTRNTSMIQKWLHIMLLLVTRQSRLIIKLIHIYSEYPHKYTRCVLALKTLRYKPQYKFKVVYYNIEI